jgi:benzoylformate decarboxylase
VFPDVFPSLDSPFRADAKIVHIDLSAYDIAKNHPITLGLLADPKPTLRLLAEKLREQMTEAQKTGTRARAARIATEKDSARATQFQADAGSSRSGSVAHVGLRRGAGEAPAEGRDHLR